MDRSSQIIRTSWIGIAANILLTGFKAAVGILASSVAIVMDAVNELLGASIPADLTREIRPLVPDKQVVIVVDHNYSE